MLQFLLALLALTWSCATSRRNDVRVYKGELDTLNEFPFLMSLERLYQKENASRMHRVCTGSLIADNWVLTAAHCLRLTGDPNLFIRYGDFSVPATKTKLFAKTFEQYVPSSSRIGIIGWRHDIGLVLTEKIPKPHVKVPAIDYKALFGLPVKYAGFGIKTLEDQVPHVPFHLLEIYPGAPRVGEGIIIPCINIKDYGPVICVASKCSNHLQDSRKGDSGGPLVLDGLVVGVVKGPASLGILMGGGSYTPVSLYLDWIKHVISTKGL